MESKISPIIEKPQTKEAHERRQMVRELETLSKILYKRLSRREITFGGEDDLYNKAIIKLLYRPFIRQLNHLIEVINYYKQEASEEEIRGIDLQDLEKSVGDLDNYLKNINPRDLENLEELSKKFGNIMELLAEYIKIFRGDKYKSFVKYLSKMLDKSLYFEEQIGLGDNQRESIELEQSTSLVVESINERVLLEQYEEHFDELVDYINDVGIYLEMLREQKSNPEVEVMREVIRLFKEYWRIKDELDRFPFDVYEERKGKKVERVESSRIERLRELFGDNEELFKKVLKNIEEGRSSSLKMHPADLGRILEDRKKELWERLEGLLFGSEEYEFNYDALKAITISILNQLRRELKQGFAVTESLKKKELEIISLLLSGQSVLLEGHTGTGKTAFAIHIAKRMAEAFGVEDTTPIMIFGSIFTSKEDLFGYLGLVGKEGEKEKRFNEIIEEVKGNIRQLLDAVNEIYEGVSDDIKKKYGEDTVKEFIKSAIEDKINEAKEGGVSFQTAFIEGPIIKAMREGKVVIIDEYNFMQPQVLGSLNSILSRISQVYEGTRDKVETFDGRKISIKPGFGIILTGNPADDPRYQGRVEIDHAFRNRFRIFDYNELLPQEVKCNYNNSLIDFNERNEKPIKGRELFQLGLAVLWDRGQLKAPTDVLDQLWMFCSAIKNLQDLYAGKVTEKVLAENTTMSVGAGEFNTPITNRDFLSILRDWKNEGFSKPLEYYIYRNLIRQIKEDNVDRRIIFNIFKYKFVFFAEDNFDTFKTNYENFNEQERPELKYFDMKTIIEAFWGMRFPEDLSDRSIIERSKKVQEMFIIKHKLEEVGKSIEQVGDMISIICDVENEQAKA